ncbi:MAG TPA: alpha/beta hydrolase [Terricaulis sp.]|nr:alpha/beta hydrolase [Terricaulis sp.]
MTLADTSASFRRLGFDLPGGRMAALGFGPEGASPDIVFIHATGFNARTYRAMLAPLGERFSVWAIDARGHGRTELPAKTWGYSSWRRHRDDLIALLEKHARRPVTLAGHSMGATVSLMIAARRPDLVSSLALFDPVIMPAVAYAAFEAPLGPLIMRHTFPLARGAARRRAHFASREEAVAGFEGRGVFKTFPRDVIEDYVGDGLVEDSKRGGFKLACAPAYEAATFCAQRNDPWGALRRVSAPIVLLRAEKNSTLVPASAHRFAAMKPDARLATVEGATHMLVIERPDRARAAIEAAVLMGGRDWREAVE